MEQLSEATGRKLTQSDNSDAFCPSIEGTLSKGKTLMEEEFSSRKSRGGWKTMPFLVGNEVCERMGSLSVLWNLVPFLYSNYNMNYVRASYIVNAISGTCSFTPLVGAYLADSCFGRYRTIIGSSIFTLVGLFLLSTAAYTKNLHAPRCTPASAAAIDECPQASTAQFAFLTTAFCFIAIGSGGLRSSTYPFGADQFEDSTPKGAQARQRFFNWFYFFTSFSLLVGLTLIVYIQNSISWGLGYLVLAIAMAVSIILFISGASFYKYASVAGNSYASLAQVLVAAYTKKNRQLPHPSKLYEMGDKGEARLPHTAKLSCLDKAAIMLPGDVEEDRTNARSPWRLCTVQQVEECKSVLNYLGMLYPIQCSADPAGKLNRGSNLLHKHANTHLPSTPCLTASDSNPDLPGGGTRVRHATSAGSEETNEESKGDKLSNEDNGRNSNTSSDVLGSWSSGAEEEEGSEARGGTGASVVTATVCNDGSGRDICIDWAIRAILRGTTRGNEEHVRCIGVAIICYWELWS